MLLLLLLHAELKRSTRFSSPSFLFSYWKERKFLYLVWKSEEEKARGDRRSQSASVLTCVGKNFQRLNDNDDDEDDEDMFVLASLFQ